MKMKKKIAAILAVAQIAAIGIPMMTAGAMSFGKQTLYEDFENISQVTESIKQVDWSNVAGNETLSSNDTYAAGAAAAYKTHIKGKTEYVPEGWVLAQQTYFNRKTGANGEGYALGYNGYGSRWSNTYDGIDLDWDAFTGTLVVSYDLENVSDDDYGAGYMTFFQPVLSYRGTNEVYKGLSVGKNDSFKMFLNAKAKTISVLPWTKSINYSTAADAGNTALYVPASYNDYTGENKKTYGYNDYGKWIRVNTVITKTADAGMTISYYANGSLLSTATMDAAATETAFDGWSDGELLFSLHNSSYATSTNTQGLDNVYIGIYEGVTMPLGIRAANDKTTIEIPYYNTAITDGDVLANNDRKVGFVQNYSSVGVKVEKQAYGANGYTTTDITSSVTVTKRQDKLVLTNVPERSAYDKLVVTVTNAKDFLGNAMVNAKTTITDGSIAPFYEDFQDDTLSDTVTKATWLVQDGVNHDPIPAKSNEQWAAKQNVHYGRKNGPEGAEDNALGLNVYWSAANSVQGVNLDWKNFNGTLAVSYDIENLAPSEYLNEGTYMKSGSGGRLITPFISYKSSSDPTTPASTMHADYAKKMIAALPTTYLQNYVSGDTNLATAFIFPKQTTFNNTSYGFDSTAGDKYYPGTAESPRSEWEGYSSVDVIITKNEAVTEGDTNTADDIVLTIKYYLNGVKAGNTIEVTRESLNTIYGSYDWSNGKIIFGVANGGIAANGVVETGASANSTKVQGLDNVSVRIYGETEIPESITAEASETSITIPYTNSAVLAASTVNAKARAGAVTTDNISVTIKNEAGQVIAIKSDEAPNGWTLLRDTDKVTINNLPVREQGEKYTVVLGVTDMLGNTVSQEVEIWDGKEKVENPVWVDVNGTETEFTSGAVIPATVVEIVVPSADSSLSASMYNPDDLWGDPISGVYDAQKGGYVFNFKEAPVSQNTTYEISLNNLSFTTNSDSVAYGEAVVAADGSAVIPVMKVSGSAVNAAVFNAIYNGNALVNAIKDTTTINVGYNAINVRTAGDKIDVQKVFLWEINSNNQFIPLAVYSK